MPHRLRTAALATGAACLILAAVGRGQQAPAGSAASREQAWRANNLGVAQLEQYDYESASRSFRDALRLAPDLAAAHLNLAIALFYAAHVAEAAAEARIAVTALPGSPSTHYVAGLIARAEDRVDAAAAEFERVRTIDPADAGSSVQLGQLRLQQRQYAEALQLFNTALTTEPYNVTAAYNAGLALTRAGRAAEGAQAMQRFEALRDSVYGVTYAQAYLSQGRYAEAIASTGAEPELVDTAMPAVTFADATASFVVSSGSGTPADAPRSAGDAAGGVMLFDADQDGDLDLLEVGDNAVRFLRNDGRRLADETARTGFASLRRGAGAVAGDCDNDGRIDVVVFADDGVRLMHQKGDATFEDVTPAARLPPPPVRPRAAAFADLDHDGDLDLVIAGAALQFMRNNGNGTFTDTTAALGLGAPIERPIAVAPTDFDNRRDIDLLIADAVRGVLLFRNMRDGTFREWTGEAGLSPGASAYSALAIGDVNKDGFPDVFLGRRGDAGVLALSDGRGRFRISPAPPESRDVRAAQFVDYDNDGLLDLLTSSDRQVRLFRNVGGERWIDATAPAKLDALVPAGTETFQSMALGDIDRDGDIDVVMRMAAGGVRVWRNDGGNRLASVRVALTARVSNRSGIGAKVELRAGSLRQTLETASASPAVAPVDVVFGLGRRAAADVVRVLWPSGILQAETAFDASAPGRPRVVAITEVDRKPSSCPYLFTWNGTRFEFVTDFMGGGEIGDWIAPSVWSQPDPDEYVRIRGDQLKPRDGRYELRVTNELEETLFVDRMQLVAVAHPEDVAIYPNEGLRQPPRPPFRMLPVRDIRPPVHATDEHGHDVLPLVAALDRRYPDDFTVLPIRGYAAPHELTLDLGTTSDGPVLLLTGWTDYAFSSDNVAASQGGIEMSLPSLQVRDSAGRWRTVIDDLGFPVGRPQTIAIDLEGKFLSASRDVRILTSMRIYWDQIQVGSRADPSLAQVTRLEAARADLHWRGFSAESSPDGREPFGFDYERVSTALPWKTLAGRYTREGDVRPLLAAVDDMFVISRPGDELSLSFDARPLRALPAGWTRTFLLFAHGYSKEMNPRSATTEVVGPLPFRGMRGYPYGSDEHYPQSRAHREYIDRYNTRIVTRVLPPLDTVR